MSGFQRSPQEHMGQATIRYLQTKGARFPTLTQRLEQRWAPLGRWSPIHWTTTTRISFRAQNGQVIAHSTAGKWYKYPFHHSKPLETLELVTDETKRAIFRGKRFQLTAEDGGGAFRFVTKGIEKFSIPSNRYWKLGPVTLGVEHTPPTPYRSWKSLFQRKKQTPKQPSP